MRVNDQKINFQIQCYVTYKTFLVLYDLLIHFIMAVAMFLYDVKTKFINVRI